MTFRAVEYFKDNCIGVDSFSVFPRCYLYKSFLESVIEDKYSTENIEAQIKLKNNASDNELILPKE